MCRKQITVFLRHLTGFSGLQRAVCINIKQEIFSGRLAADTSSAARKIGDGFPKKYTDTIRLNFQK
jgi:hypothetical protein